MKKIHWQAIFGVTSAIVTFLLVPDLHPQVILSPVLLLFLGCVNVGLAVLRPGGDPPQI